MNEPRVERARIAVEASIDQLRDAIFALHPTVLEHVGLAGAIDSVAGMQSRRAGFAVAVEVDSTAASSLDPLIFTVCRELLTNAAEHAAAARVAVRVEDRADRVEIEVSDDGRGFEKQALTAAVTRGHIGLASITERVEALGGVVQINSAPGAGTRVQVVLPAEDAKCNTDSPGRDGPTHLPALLPGWSWSGILDRLNVSWPHGPQIALHTRSGCNFRPVSDRSCWTLAAFPRQRCALHVQARDSRAYTPTMPDRCS